MVNKPQKGDFIMKLATTTGDFSQYTDSQELAIEYIAKSGFKYIDYNFGKDYSVRNGVYSENWKEHIENINKKCDDLGVKLIQSHSPMGRPVADDNKEFIADTIRCVEACGMMGIPNIVVHSGYAYWLTKEECFRKNKEFYMPILEEAEKWNVNVLVENFNRMVVPNVYWIDNAPDLLEMIEYIDHPLCHGCWDAGHANMQMMPQDEALKIVGKHIYAVHIQDNFGDLNNDNHIAPFFGNMNMDAVMHGLLDIGYKGYFTFEATNFFMSAGNRKQYHKDDRLMKAPLSLRLKGEELLYEIGKTILTAYDCFEE